MQNRVTVIGGVNMDVSATMNNDFVAGDSIPGKVSMSCGGVAHNIAHNLCLLGHEVQFVTVFGGDVFGKMCREACMGAGFGLSQSAVLTDARNGMYLCVNDNCGDMVAAVVDNDIMQEMTPDFIASRIDAVNQSTMVVADTNLSTEALRYLVDHSTAPLVVDTVSTVKAARIVDALKQSSNRRMHTLKLNRQEALSVTGCESVQEAALSLVALGVEHVFVTLGDEGVFYCSQDAQHCYDAPSVKVVNTTGAGDAFVAGIVHGFLLGLPIEQVVQVGQKAAAAALMTLKTVNSDIKKYI